MQNPVSKTNLKTFKSGAFLKEKSSLGRVRNTFVKKHDYKRKAATLFSLLKCKQDRKREQHLKP